MYIVNQYSVSISTFSYVISCATGTWKLKTRLPDSFEPRVLDAKCVLPIRHT